MRTPLLAGLLLLVACPGATPEPAPSAAPGAQVGEPGPGQPGQAGRPGQPPPDQRGQPGQPPPDQRGQPGQPPPDQRGQPGQPPPGQRERQRQGRLSLFPAELDQIRELCTQKPVIPKAPDDQPWYTGLLNDAHVHTSMEHDQGPMAIALLQEMNASGIGQGLIQPEHAPGMQQHAGFKAVLRQLEATWGEIGAVCPRLRPLVYVFNPDDPADWAYVEERLDTGSYAGVGEIEFRHSRLPMQYDPRSPLMEQVYDRLEVDGGTLHFQASPHPGSEHLPATMRAIALEHPGAHFLWFACRSTPGEALPPNMACNTVIYEGLGQGESLADQAWGSDMGPTGFPSGAAGVLPYGSIAEAAAVARRLLGSLDPTDADAVAHGRFESALGQRR